MGNLLVGTDPQDGGIDTQHSTEWDRRFEREADANETGEFDDFRKGVNQETQLRVTLDYYGELRILRGPRPSKIREIDIVESRLVKASSPRKAKGCSGEARRRPETVAPTSARKVSAKGRNDSPSTLHQVSGRSGLSARAGRQIDKQGISPEQLPRRCQWPI